MNWYTKAANQGNAGAQAYLGTCYLNGTGVAKDEKEAVKWYTKAAEQGNAIAQANLGYCYEAGRGVVKDEKEAMRWYSMAAKQGSAIAQYSLAICYLNGTGVAKDEKEAVKWYTKAANQGNAGAQANLGFCYEKGMGVAKGEKDADEAAAVDPKILATTCPMGACKWKDEYTATLARRRVLICPDRDKAGQDHALGVAKALRDKGACQVRLVRWELLWPTAPMDGKLDFYDWMQVWRKSA